MSENIAQRILQILKEKKIKPTPFEETKGISRGYLKKAADTGTGLGIEIVEKILLEYPDIDPIWLITGKELRRNTDKKLTPVDKSSDNKENRNPSSMEEILNHLVQGDTNYILINKELILEKYRLVSIEELEADKLEADRKHEEIIRELEERKNQVHGLYKIISEITSKLPDPGKSTEVNKG